MKTTTKGLVAAALLWLSGLAQAADLTGRIVLAPGNSPAANAAVIANCSGRDFSSNSDQTGRYQLSGLPRHANCDVTVRHGSSDSTRVRVRVGASKTWLNLELVRLPNQLLLRTK